ncbi:MAG: cytosolic protein [Alphaproteobacteria bacterium]
MKAAVICTSSGPIAVVTSQSSLSSPGMISQLKGKGIEKFIAWEVPVALAQERYGHHYTAVMQDLHQTDDLRVLDMDGARVFQHFRLTELGAPVMHEA